jgi:hypothetical protein
MILVLEMMAMATELARMTFCVSVGSAWGRESVTITNMLTLLLLVFCHDSRDDNLAVQTLDPTQVYVFHFN